MRVYNIVGLFGMAMVFVAGCRLLLTNRSKSVGFLFVGGASTLSVAILVNLLSRLLYRFGILNASSSFFRFPYLSIVATVSALGMVAVGAGCLLSVSQIIKRQEPQPVTSADG